MNDRATCQSCQYLSLALQRPAACERHAGPSFITASIHEPSGRDGIRQNGAAAPHFTVGELLRLQRLRAHVRQRLADGGYPDDLPAEVWRRSEA